MQVIIGLGSNLGDPLARLQAAAAALGHIPHVQVLSKSHIYQTPAWGEHAAGQAYAYLNAAVLIDTELSLDAVLGMCFGLEASLGRTREAITNVYTARLLDADILFAGDVISDTKTLTVPHPRLHKRAFALRPAADVWQHPQLLAWLAGTEVRSDAAQMVRTSEPL